ncbi:HAD-IA family hydrolase [Catenovulum sediminis]|uniref:HAD-IA family hydrolase n=1 Tax=Catenovulum sediminis TaxID=1740262 RepID=UPI00118078FA|nr:HAD-IA family hydrolase [Catenovulum sediminis]
MIDKTTKRILHRVETLNQLQSALNQKVDGIEVDVQLTRDNKLIVFWGKVGSTQLVYELTYQQISEQINSEPLMLSEVFIWCKNKLLINLDIKDWCDCIADYRQTLSTQLIALIKKHKMQNTVLLESFNPDYCTSITAAAKLQDVDILTGCALHRTDRPCSVKTEITAAKARGVQFIFVYADQLNFDIIEHCKNLNLNLISEQSAAQKFYPMLDMVMCESPIANTVDIMQLSYNDILDGAAPSIRDHSIRHAQIATIIAKELNLTTKHISTLQRICWAHDIGGFMKTDYPEIHCRLLQWEFKACHSNQHGVKPSYNPKLCYQHANDRIKQGLRSELTAEELADPFLLYQEEFALLKGEPLTDIEAKMLHSWWYHPLLSTQLLKQRNITFGAEIEAIIRCNEQPWLFDTDPHMLALRNNMHDFSLTELRLFLAIVRACDILENGNNKYRREVLRGVNVEDFQTTLAFMRYKFELDKLNDNIHVVDILEKLMQKRSPELISVVSAARESNTRLPGDEVKPSSSAYNSQQNKSRTLEQYEIKNINNKLKNIEVILFDMDGTLIKSDHLAELAIKQVMHSLNIDITGLDLKFCHGKTWSLIAQNLHQFYPEIHCTSLENILLDAFDSLFLSQKPIYMQGIDKFIKKLSNTHRMAIVTAAHKAAVEHVLKHANFANEIYFYICDEHVTESKPSPECYLKAAQTFDVSPEQCLVFEDSVSGLQAAQAAGMKSIAVLGDNLDAPTGKYLNVIRNFESLEHEFFQALKD